LSTYGLHGVEIETQEIKELYNPLILLVQGPGSTNLSGTDLVARSAPVGQKPGMVFDSHYA
jgi:hypothetical protein